MLRQWKNRVAKCHGYDGYIRVKKLASWGKKFGVISGLTILVRVKDLTFCNSVEECTAEYENCRQTASQIY